MKILMLNPPFHRRYSRQSRSPCVTKGGTFYYPYFLAYATGVLESEFDVKLIDAVAKDWTREKTVEFAKEFAPELVVVDTSTPSIKNDLEVAGEIKNALPDTHINLVGTHPTALPEETLQGSNGVDSVCRGEYELTLLDLAKTLDAGDTLMGVDGLSFKLDEEVINNRERELLKDLDELPFVSKVYKRHLDVGDYFYASLRYPQVTILTARGCPYNCSFCNAPFKNSYRARSVGNVIEELKYIKKELPGVREVMFEDETFPANQKRTVELCDLMLKEGIKLKWSCNVRVDTKPETLKNMKKAGCRLLCVGFESPTQTALDGVGKKTTKEKQVDFMKNARSTGLLVNGCFILGLPNDTKDSIRETINFAKKLNPDTAQFYPLMVYPGTASYAWAKEKGYLETEDYSKWIDSEGKHSTALNLPEIGSRELVKMCDDARREFYLRPGFIFYKIIQSLKNPEEGLRTLKSARTFIKNIKLS
ncbi:B12-binding domain-containing radical SAM protein [archaeon]|nr:B12-binding domain-containing radical SAM protein [archaeon]